MLATFFPDNVEYALRLANAQIAAGDAKEGLATIEALRTQLPSVCDPRTDLVARLLTNLAIQERRAGNLDASLRLNREAVAIRRGIGDRNSLAISLNNIGNVLRDQGDLSGAAQHYRDSADIH